MRKTAVIIVALTLAGASPAFAAQPGVLEAEQQTASSAHGIPARAEAAALLSLQSRRNNCNKTATPNNDEALLMEGFFTALSL